MGALTTTIVGEFDVPLLPNDIVERIGRRVDEDRLFSVRKSPRFRMDMDAVEEGYRAAQPRKRVVHLAEVKGSTKIDLEIEGTRVKYAATFSFAEYLVIILIGAPFAFYYAGLPSSISISWGVLLFFAGFLATLVWLAHTTLKEKLRKSIEKVFRDEAAHAHREAQPVRIDVPIRIEDADILEEEPLESAKRNSRKLR